MSLWLKELPVLSVVNHQKVATFHVVCVKWCRLVDVREDWQRTSEGPSEGQTRSSTLDF